MNLQDEAMRGIVAKAVFEALDPTKRDLLMVEALERLMAPGEYDNHRGGRKPSPLAEAFQDACDSVVRRTVYNEIEKEDSSLRQQLNAFIAGVIERILSDGVLGDRIAKAVGDEVSNKLRYADLRPKEAENV